MNNREYKEISNMLSNIIEDIKKYNIVIKNIDIEVFKYVKNKTNSRERGIIVANRYNDIDGLLECKKSNIKKILSKKHLSKLPDIDKASDILDKHIKSNNRILQIVDMDVDGITSGAIGYLIFKNIFKYKKYDVIVNKREWNNGINDTIVKNVLELNKRNKIDLIVTSDHGSSDGNRLKILKDNGIDVIVTDHHIVGDNAPLGIVDAFINHKRTDSKYHNDITGATTLYFFYLYYNLKYGKHDNNLFYDLIPYVALTIISDKVSLKDCVNRKIVKYGLNMLNSNKYLTPFWNILREINNNRWLIDEEYLSYNVISMLNSPGRIDNPDKSFEFMVADSVKKCKVLLENIQDINSRRKQLQNDAIISLDKVYNKDIVTVLYRKDIEGVQGILASMVLNNTKGISFCFTNKRNSELLVGSGRSTIKDISLKKLLDILKEKEYMVRYGGHDGACGLEIKSDSLEQFYKDMLDITKNIKYNDNTYVDDVIVSNAFIYKHFMANYAESPFGQDYDKPLYVSKFDFVYKKVIEKNGARYLIGSVKLSTDRKSNILYKLLYRLDSNDNIDLYKNDVYIVYNIGLNDYYKNTISILARNIYV